MFKLFTLCLLLLYFWYFYNNSSKPVPKPTSPAPSNPSNYGVEFIKSNDNTNTFQFIENRIILWQHTLSEEKFLVRKGHSDIIPKDPCLYVPNGRSVAATGQFLYEYLKNNPDIKEQLSVQQNTPYTVQDGYIFYYNCMNKHIKSVGMCPSGHTFQKGRCLEISACTGKRDGTVLPHSNFLRAQQGFYIKCNNGREFDNYCGTGQFFFHDRCVSRDDLTHLCKFTSNSSQFVDVDAMTKVHCVNGQPVFKRCDPETQFFEKDECEPAICVGHPDGQRLPLSNHNIAPFQFSPGYVTCHQNKIHETVTCPQIWDDLLSKGDNLTHLPMVFDGHQCSIPSFCENVYSNDSTVIVPSHEFTKDVRNWSLSALYDQAKGYMCQQGQKRKIPIPPGMRISKRFKLEAACDVPLLPIPENPDQFYDCTHQQIVHCPATEYFNGTTCAPRPENAFSYQNIPLFKFDSLNFESWITPWDYKTPILHEHSCRDPESTYISLYDICSHPDCIKYDFLSMIPDLALLLPTPENAQCRFDEVNQRLVKEPVDFPYRFWDQRIVKEWETVEQCTPGQKLKTGNFIWDSTIYATCDESQPFVFCPSTHTNSLVSVDQHYACATPDTNTVEMKTINQFIPFATDEVRRILPIQWNNQQGFKLNKRYQNFVALPQDGFTIPRATRVNLEVNAPVNLELRYRVTHPPHVSFEYDEGTQEVKTQHGIGGQGFLLKKNNFTTKALTFPRYRSEKYVDSFTDQYL